MDEVEDLPDQDFRDAMVQNAGDQTLAHVGVTVNSGEVIDVVKDVISGVAGIFRSEN